MHSGILRDDNNIMRGRHKLLNERQGQLNLTWEEVVKRDLKSGIHPENCSWIEACGKRLSMCLNCEPGFISPKIVTIIHAFLLFVWLLFPILLLIHVGY